MRTCKVLKPRSVKIVCATLGHVIYNRPGGAAIFHAEIVGDHADFIQHVLVAEKNRWAGDRIVVVGLAIDLKIVRATAQPIRRERCAVIVAEGIATRVRDSRDEERQGVESASQRQF